MFLERNRRATKICPKGRNRRARGLEAPARLRPRTTPQKPPENPLDGTTAAPISGRMETSLQSSNGLPRTRRRFVDAVQKIGPPPARSPFGDLARETIVLVIDGVSTPVEVERQARPCGGAQGYWLCPACSRRCCALFIIRNALRCRVCGSLDYRSRHVLHPALIRAAKLRRKLGAGPGLLSAIPKRPPRWRRDYWLRMVRELQLHERVIGDMLGATLRAVKRHKARLDDGRR